MIDFDLYIFVIDTDDSQPNRFAQELGAFMTGVPQIGFGKTEEYAQSYRDDMGFRVDGYNDHIIHVGDERGYFSTRPTPGWFSDGIGNHYREGSTSDEAVQKEYRVGRAAHIKRTGSPPYGGGKEKFSKHPAHQSVAIFMDRRPTVEEVQVMIERADKFVFKGGQTPKIEGFRLLFRTVHESTLVTHRRLSAENPLPFPDQS